MVPSFQLIIGVQDRDTLIEQSPNYSNRTFSVSIKVGSVMESACTYTFNEVHWSVFIILFIISTEGLQQHVLQP